MMDGVILQEIVGIREKITLALEEAVRGVLVVGDVLPEPVLAEITGVGLLEEVLGAAQPGIFHFFRNGDGRCTLGEGQPDTVGLRVGGKCLDDVVVGAAGDEVELTVLELACRALFACIPAEDVGVLDDARRLELLGDGCHAAALLDAHTHRFAGGSTAVDLFRMASRQPPAASTRISSTIRIIFAAPPFLLFLCFASCAMYTLLYHSVQLSIISRI